MRPLEQLVRAMGTLDSCLVGFSGGVDSALVAVAARRALGSRGILAVLGVSPSLAEVQRRTANAIATQFDIPLVEAPTREFEDPRYVANTPNRCYFCKSELWATLSSLARERGLATLLDGTNADDLAGGSHRPGAGAGREWNVRSPLAELGMSKDTVRTAARELDLPIWDAPAAPCLASRVRYGLAVTPERVDQIERAEAVLRGFGVRGDLRVRHLDDVARVEVIDEERDRVRAAWSDIAAQIECIGFDRVELDRRGYRQGAMIAEVSRHTCVSSSR